MTIRHRLTVLGVVAVSGILVASGSAAVIAVDNPGFEAQAGALSSDNSFTQNVVTDWVTTPHPSAYGIGAFNPGVGSYPGEAPEGILIVYNDGGTLSQVLGDSLTTETTYTLTVLAGDRIGKTFAGGTAQLWAGASMLASTPFVAPGTDGTFALTTLVYTTGLSLPNANPLEIRFVVPFIDGNNTVDFDDVELTANPVPEPASMALLALTCLPLARRRVR